MGIHIEYQLNDGNTSVSNPALVIAGNFTK